MDSAGIESAIAKYIGVCERQMFTLREALIQSRVDPGVDILFSTSEARMEMECAYTEFEVMTRDF